MSSRSLPSLSNGQLETLLAALDPRLEGFGAGGSELDDAAAYLARLGLAGEDGQGRDSPLIDWLSTWGASGGNRETLALAVATLLADRQASRHAQTLQLLWGGEGEPLLQQLPALLATVERRLLLVFGPGAEDDALVSLREAIQVRLHQVPSLELLAVAGVAGPRSDAIDAVQASGLRLLVCDDLIRWEPNTAADALIGLEPSFHLRSEGQAEGAWMQVQRLLAQGWLRPLERWGAVGALAEDSFRSASGPAL